MTTYLINDLFLIILIVAAIITLFFIVKLIIRTTTLVGNINDELNRNKDNVASAISNINDITTVATSIALDVNDVTSSINNKMSQLDTLLHSIQRTQRNASKVKSTVDGINSFVKIFNKFRGR